MEDPRCPDCGRPQMRGVCPCKDTFWGDFDKIPIFSVKPAETDPALALAMLAVEQAREDLDRAIRVLADVLATSQRK